MSLRFASSNASIFVEISMPVTRTPSAASGTAMRPVPMPTSSSLGVGAISTSLDRLDGLVRSAQRLDSATADLLETGWSRVDLSALVGAFAVDYRLMLAGRRDILTVDVAAGVAIRGRDDIIETILENLVDNAVSFSPTGATVVVTLSSQDGIADLQVRDDGPGIDPDRLSRVFDRYYSSRPAVEHGGDTEMHFGIGLWLVRQHTLALGGTIHAENRSTGGLTMVVRIPLIA